MHHPVQNLYGPEHFLFRSMSETTEHIPEFSGVSRILSSPSVLPLESTPHSPHASPKTTGRREIYSTHQTASDQLYAKKASDQTSAKTTPYQHTLQSSYHTLYTHLAIVFTSSLPNVSRNILLPYSTLHYTFTFATQRF